MFKHALITAVSIGSCLAIGKVLAHFFGFLPASLYGMLIYALLLTTDIVDNDGIGLVIGKIIYFMPVVFLPVCVGVIKYGELFSDSGWKLVLVGVSTTLSLLLLVGLWSQRAVRGSAND